MEDVMELNSPVLRWLFNESFDVQRVFSVSYANLV
jgi:hypothetical protein